MKSKLLILLYAAVSLYVIFNREWYKNVFMADTSSYYLYLPAVFIYHDLGNLGFYPVVNKKYDLTGPADNYGIFDQPTGRRTNKYAIGSAVFELPFFLMAHAFCLFIKNYPADGYSIPYQLLAAASCIFWVCMGLIFLRGFLKKYFNDNITAFVILCIAFGTEIYFYTAFFPGMSHPFGFFLFAGVLYSTDALYRSQNNKYIYWLGILLGLVIITRPVNILVVIIPLFWQVYNLQSLRERMVFLRKKIAAISVAAVLFLIVALIQMGYWKYTAGSWIHYSYEGEGFNFLRPHIIEGLFSYQKGWFVYTPIAFIAMVGLIYFWIKDKRTAPALIVFFGLMIYVVFCWQQWFYGGGFSARALVEALPIAAFPFAFLCRGIYSSSKGMVKKIAFTALMCFLIALNLFQSYQFSLGTIDGTRMTRAYYWKVFGKTWPTVADQKLLMTSEEFSKQWQDCLK